MQTSFKTPVFALLLTTLTVSMAASLAIGQTPRYYVIKELGTLDQTTSEAYGLNSYGQVVGRVPLQLPERPKAFHWQNDQMVDISDTVHFSQLFVQYRGEAFDVSDGDIVVGAGWNKIKVDAVEIWFADGFVLRPAVQTDFGGPFPGDAVTALTPVNDLMNSAAVGINQGASVSGRRPIYVVGWVDVDQTYRSRGFLLSPVNGQWFVAGGPLGNSLMHDLGALSAANSESAGTSVNDSGDVVGYSYTDNGGYRAYLILPEDTDADGLPDRWNRDNDADGVNDLMLDLGTLGGKNSWARGLSNRLPGQGTPIVVGEADTAGLDTHAFVWTAAGGMVSLGTLGGSDSSASRINNLGHVCGWAETATREVHAFVVIPEDTDDDGIPDLWYRDSDGDGVNDLMIDLNRATLAATKWTIREARDINDSGEITGWGSFRGAGGTTGRQAFFMRLATTDEIAVLTPPPTDPVGGPGGGGSGGPSVALELDPLFRSASSAPLNPSTDDSGGAGGVPSGGARGVDCGLGLLFGIPLTMIGLTILQRSPRRRSPGSRA